MEAIANPNGLSFVALPPWFSSSWGAPNLPGLESASYLVARYLKRRRCDLERTEEMGS